MSYIANKWTFFVQYAMRNVYDDIVCLVDKLFPAFMCFTCSTSSIVEGQNMTDGHNMDPE